MNGIYLAHDTSSAVSYAHKLASTVRSASIESPEAVERHASNLRNAMNEIREALALIESKLPKPKEVRRADAA
jgi:hypothetical protein